MGKAWSFIWRWIGNLLRIKALWELLPAGATAVITGYLAWLGSQPLWIIVVASLLAAFAMLALIHLVQSHIDHEDTRAKASLKQETHGHSQAINAGRDVHIHATPAGIRLQNSSGFVISENEMDTEFPEISHIDIDRSSDTTVTRNKTRVGVPNKEQPTQLSTVFRGPILTYVEIAAEVQWKFERKMSRCSLQRIVVKNSQTAIPETAFNVRAAITYQHADGRKRLVVGGADWLNQNPITSDQPGPDLVGQINLESNEEQSLVILIRHGDGTYYAACETGQQFQPLALGLWEVTVNITADNAEPLTLQGTIELTSKLGNTRLEYKTNPISGKKFTPLKPSDTPQGQQSR